MIFLIKVSINPFTHAWFYFAFFDPINSLVPTVLDFKMSEMIPCKGLF